MLSFKYKLFFILNNVLLDIILKNLFLFDLEEE